MAAVGIGKRVRDLRIERGFARQAALGELVGVDQSVISDIERGSGFGAAILMGLCEHLRTTPEYIMNGTSRDAAAEAELIAIFRGLSVAQRSAMLAMARGLSTQSGELPATQAMHKPEKKRA